MIITQKALARRTFLKGLGVSVGLPFLDAMMPALGHAQLKKPPVRLAFFYVPNGIDIPNWNPSYTGKLGELPRILKAMEPYRDDFLMLGNLTQNYARGLLDGGGDHGRCSANWLTGAHVKKSTTEIRIDGEMSMDQLIARRVGKQTKFSSLEIGMEDARQSGSCDSGYSCAYTNNIAWKSSTQPLPPILDPRVLFERLFGANADQSPLERARRMRVKSAVLDLVQQQTKDLQRDLGPADRHKLDEYLTGIRSIEQQMENVSKDETPVDPGMGKPAGAPVDFAEHFRLLTDMLTVAFRADMTRVATFMITREGTSRPYREIGISDGHHPLSHHGGNAEQLAKITAINEYHIKNFAAWMGRLASMQEGDGRLMDNLMIVYGAGLNDGNGHLHEDLPTLLVGRGGGTLKPGRRVMFRKETPFCNLHLSLMDRMGVEVDQFGDSSGRLSGLDKA